MSKNKNVTLNSVFLDIRALESRIEGLLKKQGEISDEISATRSEMFDARKKIAKLLPDDVKEAVAYVGDQAYLITETGSGETVVIRPIASL